MKDGNQNMTPKDSPYIDHTGTMIIPFSADPKYHFWNGGQPILKTLLELNASEDVWVNIPKTRIQEIQSELGINGGLSPSLFYSRNPR